MTKLLEVARFELAYQLRRRSIWACAAAVPALAFYVMRNFVQNAQENGTYLNAPIDIASVSFMASLFGLLVTAALLSRRALASYVAGALLFVVSMFTWAFVARTLGRWELATHLDPFGAAAISFL